MALRPQREAAPRRAAIIRLLIVAVATFAALLAAYQAPVSFRLDVGTGDDGRYLANFQDQERSQWGTFRWSQGDSSIALPGVTAGPVDVTITMIGLPGPDGSIAPVSLSSAGRKIAEIVPGPTPAPYTVHVPAGGAPQWLSGDLSLELATRTAPAGAKDARQLGVAITDVVVHSSGSSPLSLPPLQRLARFWAITVLIWLLTSRLWPAERPGRHILVARAWVRAAPTALVLAGECAGIALMRSPATLYTSGLLPLLAVAYVGLSLPSWVGRLSGALHVSETRGDNRRKYAVLAGVAVIAASIVPFGLGSAWIGAVLVIGGAALAAAGAIDPVAPPPRRWALHVATLPAIALGLLGIAVAFHLYRLDIMPYGLFRDDGRIGLEALRVLNDPGYRPIYVANRIDTAGLLFYLIAVVFKLAGSGIFQLRLVPALVGCLAAPGAFFLGRRLFDHRVGLIAGLLVAVSSWYVSISRLSFDFPLGPALNSFALLLLLTGTVRRRWTYFAGAGLCIGVAMNGYHTSRLLPLAVVGVFIALVFMRKLSYKEAARYLVITGLPAVLMAGPLLYYAVAHTSEFTSRPGQTFLLGQSALATSTPLQLVSGNVEKHLLMFNYQGDSNGRHNLPLDPQLDPISRILFPLGLVLLLRKRTPMAVVSLVWLAGTLIPGLMAVDAPHAMRTAEAIPIIYIITAFGLVSVWDTLATAASKRLRLITTVVVISAIGLAIGFNYDTYFVRMSTEKAAWSFFYPVQTRVGEWVANMSRDGQLTRSDYVYMESGVANHPVTAFLTHGLWKMRSYDNNGWAGPSKNGKTVLIASGYHPFEQTATISHLVPDAAIRPEPGPLFPDGSSPSFVAYWALSGKQAGPRESQAVDFSGGPSLAGYSLVRDTSGPGSNTYVDLYWRRGGAAEGKFYFEIGPAGKPAVTAQVAPWFPMADWGKRQMVVDRVKIDPGWLTATQPAQMTLTLLDSARRQIGSAALAVGP